MGDTRSLGEGTYGEGEGQRDLEALASGTLVDGIYRVDETTGHVDTVVTAGHVLFAGIDANPFLDASVHVMTVDRERHRVRLLHFKLS